LGQRPIFDPAKRWHDSFILLPSILIFSIPVQDFFFLMFNNIDIFNNQSYTMNIMAQKKLTLLPSVERRLEQMGEQIKLARLRRRISVQLVAERANISRSTLWAIEKGSPSVSMGAYAQVLLAIGLVDDLLLVAKDDVLGRKLQDLGLPVGKRAPKGEA